MSQAQRHQVIRGRIDWHLLMPAVILAALGVVMVASSSIAVAQAKMGDPAYYLTRHVIYLVLGMAAAAVALRIEMLRLEQVGRLWLLLAFIALLLVFMPGLGHTVNGATRWINLGVIRFQAVEAVKLLMILYLAGYLVRQGHTVQMTLTGVLKPILAVGGMVGLLLLQPDFGSAVLLVAIAVGMIWLAGARIGNLGLLAMAGLPLLIWAAMFESYRMKRVFSFLRPWETPFSDGFQLTQSLIAVGRGEWFGVGLGASVQKLFYLPEAHTDFIVAVLAEELGLIGLLLTLALFVWLTGRAFLVGFRCMQMGQRFAGYCVFGIALWLSVQALISIGVNMGMLPTKGLTLPLISSGGSSLIMTCLAIGLLLRCSAELDRAERQGLAAADESAADELQDSPAGPEQPLPPGNWVPA
ncbi:MAG: putative lipid II flippase FtsW [Xanthomonadales bacterium]|nr:putative lipid II flippase FtsW [Xanthomonadales bacterium]